MNTFLAFLGSCFLALILVWVLGIATKYFCKVMGKLMTFVGDAPIALLGAVTTFVCLLAFALS